MPQILERKQWTDQDNRVAETEVAIARMLQRARQAEDADLQPAVARCAGKIEIALARLRSVCPGDYRMDVTGYADGFISVILNRTSNP